MERARDQIEQSSSSEWLCRLFMPWPGARVGVGNTWLSVAQPADVVDRPVILQTLHIDLFRWHDLQVALDLQGLAARLPIGQPDAWPVPLKEVVLPPTATGVYHRELFAA